MDLSEIWMSHLWVIAVETNDGIKLLTIMYAYHEWDHDWDTNGINHGINNRFIDHLWMVYGIILW